MGRRILAWSCVTAVIGVVGVVPVVLDRDSYPLSTYPMFSERISRTESVDTAILVTDGTVVHRLTPTQLAGTDEVILAAGAVSDAIVTGAADKLCAEIAGRVDRVGEIQVVTESYDSVKWYQGDKTPVQRTIHARCPSGGGE